MARKKKNNSRKALAVVLGIVGVAGLSVASASQLTVTTNDDNIAVGSGTFDLACDDAVQVDYTYDLAAGTYDEVTISDIDANCAGLTLDWTLNTSSATDPTGTVATLAGTSVTADISAVPLSADLDSIDVAIY